MKLKKILAAVAAAAVAVSTMAVSAFAADIAGGEFELDTSWGGKDFAADNFANVAEGDTVTVSYAIIPGDYHLVKFTANASGWGNIDCTTKAVNNNGDAEFKNQDDGFAVVSVDGSVTYTLTANDVASLQENGAVITGYCLKVTSVDVASAAPAAETTAETTEAAPVAEAATYDYTAAIYFADTSWAVQDPDSSVQITGNGQYTIESTKVSGAKDFGVFVIDLKGLYADHPEATAVLDKIEVDGAELTFDASKIVYGDIEENGNYRIEIYNQYGDTKADPGVDASTAINSSVKLTFTVSGLDAAAAPAPAAEETTAPAETEAAPVEEEVADEDVDVDVEPEEEEEEPEAEPVAETEAPAVEEAPVAETAAPAPATGNTAAATIVTVMAVAGVAAIAAKKRK